MSIQRQIEQLRIGGYRDKAATLEYFVGHINCAKEFEYLINFAKSGDFDFKICRNAANCAKLTGTTSTVSMILCANT